jgi:hypothetical protein
MPELGQKMISTRTSLSAEEIHEDSAFPAKGFEAEVI